MGEPGIESIKSLYMKNLQLFQTLHSTPMDFGTGDLLYPAEVHTLAAVARTPGLNLTELALAMNVSKSAVSKVVKKLLNKGLVIKGSIETNQKEVIFHLTAKGESAVLGHEAFEQKTFAGVNELLQKLTVPEKTFLIRFFQDIISSLEP